MGYRYVFAYSLVALGFCAFYACAGLYLAPKPGEPPTPTSFQSITIPVSGAFFMITVLGGAVAGVLKQQAERIERLERLLAERSPGFIAENPVTR